MRTPRCTRRWRSDAIDGATGDLEARARIIVHLLTRRCYVGAVGRFRGRDCASRVVYCKGKAARGAGGEPGDPPPIDAFYNPMARLQLPIRRHFLPDLISTKAGIRLHHPRNHRSDASIPRLHAVSGGARETRAVFHAADGTALRRSGMKDDYPIGSGSITTR